MISTLASAAAGPSTKTLNLVVELRLADSQKLPVMLVFSREDCPYCRLLEQEFLQPMRISGDYEQRISIRTLEIDHQRVLDFDGQVISGVALANRYQVELTPTILFLNTQGEELTKRLVGLGTLDYFGEEIDRSVDAAVLVSRQ